jgi:hypothetical protein
MGFGKAKVRTLPLIEGELDIREKLVNSCRCSLGELPLAGHKQDIIPESRVDRI